MCLKHSHRVMSVAWSIHGLLASGSRDNTVKIWNPSAGECLKTLEGHSRSVTCVQFDPMDAGQLVSGSDDNTVKLWSVADGKCERTFTGHR